MIKKSIVVLFAAMLMPCGMSLGQSTFSNAYGDGVHKYFSGRYQEAIMSLNSAIADNQADARPFYFRGLAQMALGNTYAAEADFQQGALVEKSSTRGRSSLVNRSLERIQGTTRLRIEQFRGNTMTSTPAVAIAGTSMPYHVVPAQYNETIVGQHLVSQPSVCQPQFVQRPVYQQPSVYTAPPTSDKSVVHPGGTISSNEPVPARGAAGTLTFNPPAANEAPGSIASATQPTVVPSDNVPSISDSQPTVSADSQIASDSLTTTLAKEPLTSEEPIDLITDPTEGKASSATEETFATDEPFDFETPAPPQPATIEDPLDAETPLTEEPAWTETPIPAEEPANDPVTEEPVASPPTTEEPADAEDPFGFETPANEEPAVTEEPDEAPATDESEGATEDPAEAEETPAEEETDDDPADLFE